MTIPRPATPAFVTALLMWAPLCGLGQEDLNPDEIVQPGPVAPRSAIGRTGNQRSQVAIATPDGAEGPTTAPPVKRSSSSRYISTREDVPPVVVQFSGKNDSIDTLHEDLTIMNL